MNLTEKIIELNSKGISVEFSEDLIKCGIIIRLTEEGRDTKHRCMCQISLSELSSCKNLNDFICCRIDTMFEEMEAAL
jgi:hypothetical protein